MCLYAIFTDYVELELDLLKDAFYELQDLINDNIKTIDYDFEEELDDYVSELGQDVVDGDVNVDGNRFTASMSYNVNRMSTDQLDYIAYEEEFANYEGAKAYLEDQGYTCK